MLEFMRVILLICDEGILLLYYIIEELFIGIAYECA
jgi:hypothetical protein